MFSFSVMGITTVLYRACYIPHGGSKPLKMHCALRSVSFFSHISLHTHTHTHTYTHRQLVIPVCLHKVREFCCQARNKTATGTETGSLLYFQLNCLTTNTKCLDIEKTFVSFTVNLRELSEVQTTQHRTFPRLANTTNLCFSPVWFAPFCFNAPCQFTKIP